MSEFLGAILLGLSFGSVYALLSVGLVLTYSTTGIFNLAFGPVAFFVAAVYYDTHVTHHWPMYLALFFAVGVVAPLVGLVFDRFLFRFLRTASDTAKLVSVLGLFVALPQMVFLWFGANTKANAIGIVPNGSHTFSPIHNVFLSRDDIAIAVTGLVVFAALTVLLQRTALGLRMRAVVESPRLTELAGVNSDRVSMSSWMLSSLIAGALFSALQAVTSIQEQTLSVVPKLVAAILSLVVAGPWIGAQLTRFTTEVLHTLPMVGR